MADESLAVERTDNGASGAYTIALDGGEQAELTWTQRDGVRSANHTYVPPAMRGRDIAVRLVGALIADARDHGFKVRPACSYVARAFDQHPEWSELRA